MAWLTSFADFTAIIASASRRGMSVPAGKPILEGLCRAANQVIITLVSGPTSPARIMSSTV